MAKLFSRRLTKKFTWIELLPGDLFNFDLVATSLTDDYTQGLKKTQYAYANESTVPAKPIKLDSLFCDLSSLLEGNLHNETWTVRYGTDSEVGPPCLFTRYEGNKRGI